MKNISKKVHNGQIVHTKDSYLYGSNGYNKPGKKGNYRMAVVVDSNKDDELALVKLTTSNKGKSLPNYKTGKSKYKNYIYTKDNENQAIKISRKFIVKNNDIMDPKTANNIKRDCINDKKRGYFNNKLLKKLKQR